MMRRRPGKADLLFICLLLPGTVSFPTTRVRLAVPLTLRSKQQQLFSVSGHQEQLEEDDLIFDATPNSKTSKEDALKVPSVRTILNFALPATAIFLCNPFLSMIDTSTVGLLAGTSQQAALNPAVSLTEYSTRLIYFLYTGTTSLMAASKNRDDEGASSKEGLVGALQLSLLVGATLGSILFLFTGPILRAMIGNDQIGA